MFGADWSRFTCVVVTSASTTTRCADYGGHGGLADLGRVYESAYVLVTLSNETQVVLVIEFVELIRFFVNLWIGDVNVVM